MNLLQYLETIKNIEINESAITAIEKKYHCNLPIIVKKILSSNEKTIFLSEERRVLSYNEILNAEIYLHVDFISYGIIPLIDCYDNNFIVYNTKSNNWCMFNIIDECSFEVHTEIIDFNY